MCALQTPLHSPAQVPPNNSKDPPPPACVEQGTSSDENEIPDKSQNPCTSPARRDSYSDSSGSGEDDSVKAPAKIPNMSWSSALHQTLSSMVSQAQGQRNTRRSQEDTICTMFYYPQKIPSKPELEDRYCQYYDGERTKQLVALSNKSNGLHLSKNEMCLCVNFAVFRQKMSLLDI